MHDGTHEDCFGCKVKSITFNPYSMPSRLNKKIQPKQPEPRWERGVPTDQRNMPFVGKDMAPIGIKKYVENRHSIEQHRRKLVNSEPER